MPTFNILSKNASTANIEAVENIRLEGTDTVKHASETTQSELRTHLITYRLKIRANMYRYKLSLIEKLTCYAITPQIVIVK